MRHRQRYSSEKVQGPWRYDIQQRMREGSSLGWHRGGSESGSCISTYWGFCGSVGLPFTCRTTTSSLQITRAGWCQALSIIVRRHTSHPHSHPTRTSLGRVSRILGSPTVKMQLVRGYAITR